MFEYTDTDVGVDSTDSSEHSAIRCGFCGDLGCSVHEERGTESELIEQGVDPIPTAPGTPAFR